MQSPPRQSEFERRRRDLSRCRQRALLVVTGEPAACRARGVELARLWGGHGVWLGEPDATGMGAIEAGAIGESAGLEAECLHPGQGRELPGREVCWVVMDAFAGLSADALGAAGGCLEGGGVLVLLAPPRSHWARFRDPECRRHCPWPLTEADYGARFWRRLDRELTGPAVWELDADRCGPAWDLITWPQTATTSDTQATMREAVAEQEQAIQAIESVVRGRRRRPLVLIAHRGRGKSAALGIAAARLLRAGRVTRVVVTAARREALHTLFRHAGETWPEARRQGDSLGDGRGELCYLPPDQVPAEPEWLLVDEAAALPAAVLRRLLRAPRIVFAGTVHGYEGSGRGFDLRFTRVLDEEAPRWRRQGLEHPLRWAADDPLEALLFRVLLLDAEPAPPLPAPVSDWHCTRLERDALAADEARLRTLFGLLVAAHYRTSPDDLRELLDAPHLEVWSASQGRDGPPVAAALVATEGGLPDWLARAVRAGRRRPHGHLLAQSLAFHGGWTAAAEQRGGRVVRIAVHPDLRRQGAGRALLGAIGSDLQQRGLDWLGSSFALDEEVIPFWHAAGFAPLRLGVRRDAASGERALQVAQGLSEAAAAWLEPARRDFSDTLPLLLGDAWRDLPPGVVAALLRALPEAFPAPAGERYTDLQAFTVGRPLLTCLPALTDLAWYLLSRQPQLCSPGERDALVLRLLQHHPDAAVAGWLGLTGVPALQRLLVAVVVRWLGQQPGADSSAD